jgi:carboxymethylenebutenolidase
MPNVTLTASDGFTFDAYRIDPEGQPRGALVVLQEIFGVNDHIRAVAAMFAGCGYTAIAPAMFDRVQRGVQLGYTGPDHETGIGYAVKLSPSAMILDITAAVQAVASAGKVGVVGYCLGGAMTWRAASVVDGVAAAVSYYGAQIPMFLNERPRVPTQFHFARRDQYLTLAKAREITEGVAGAQVFDYEADHGFACDHRAPVFDADASGLALQRTLKFFSEHLG